jgi:hypothetical protein
MIALYGSILDWSMIAQDVIRNKCVGQNNYNMIPFKQHFMLFFNIAAAFQAHFLLALHPGGKTYPG